jgi:putative membrane protein
MFNMVDNSSSVHLNNSMDGALKHYSSMFFLPSYKRVVLAIAMLCIGLIGLSSYALFSTNQGSFVNCLIFGVALFVITLIVDVIISKIILRDPIYILRRTAAVSLFCWIFWAFFLVLGVIFGLMFDTLWWFKLSLLGFGVVLTLRFVVLLATSSASFIRQLLSALLLPYLSVGIFFGFWLSMIGNTVTRFLPYLIFAPIIAYTAVFIFLKSLDKIGYRLNGVPALPLFKAFMLNWVLSANDPLERHLEKMGENADIDVTMLRFDSSKPKAALIVPLVHPGPFKNIGSSLLPSLLKKHFEEAYGCQTCTPLGLLGHELDLASQTQNFKVITHIIEAAKFETTEALASPCVQVSEGYATASCQVFGDTVFLSFTLSPKTTEDLPQELGQTVQREAQKYGLNCTIAVNCHNSLTDVIDTIEHLTEFEVAASKCIQKVASLPKKPFKVGSSTIYPKEFTLKEGMGTGGITAVTVQVEDQKSVYIVIDGNNMISGLREKILFALNASGFDASEVFTTDTHAVSALVTGSRGYHPIGEVMNQDKLINYIIEAAKEAAANLEPARAGFKHLVVPHVRVIGGSRIASLSLLVDQALKKAKRIVVPVFLTEGLLLLLLLALL